MIASRSLLIGALAFASLTGCTKDAPILPMTVHEALRKYLAKHPVIAPKRDGRGKAVDLPPVLFSQDQSLLGGH